MVNYWILDAKGNIVKEKDKNNQVNKKKKGNKFSEEFKKKAEKVRRCLLEFLNLCIRLKLRPDDVLFLFFLIIYSFLFIPFYSILTNFKNY